MSENEQQNPEQDDVEAHLLKEALAAGTLAAAMFAGTAQGAVQADASGASFARAAAIAPSQKEVSPGGAGSAVEPGPGGTQAAAPQQKEVGPGGTAPAKAKKAKKKAAKPSARRAP